MRASGQSAYSAVARLEELAAGSRVVGHRLPAGDDGTANQHRLVIAVGPPDDWCLSGARVFLRKRERLRELIVPGVDEDGDGLREAGLAAFADRIAGPFERGGGAVGAAGVWLGERPRPGVVAAG